MLAPTLHPTSFVSPRAMSDTEDCERPTAAPISCCVMPHPIRSVTSSFHFIGNIIGSPITKVNRKTDIKPREHTRMKKETIMVTPLCWRGSGLPCAIFLHDAEAQRRNVVAPRFQFFNQARAHLAKNRLHGRVWMPTAHVIVQQCAVAFHAAVALPRKKHVRFIARQLAPIDTRSSPFFSLGVRNRFILQTP